MVWEPWVELGTVNLHTNLPAAADAVIVVPPVSVPIEQLTNVNELPANVTVTVPDSVNPVPVSVAETPYGPWVGTTDSANAVTVNVVVCVSPEPTSVALIVSAPIVGPGTVNLQTSLPTVEVVIVVPPVSVPVEQLTNESELPANVTVTVLDTVNPVPVSVAELPMGPCVGATERASAVTWNVFAADASFVASSSPTTL
jgi:hypothetical protein